MAHQSTDELLGQVPLFCHLSKRGLREVSNLATRLRIEQGRALTHQGAVGREFIIVLEGTVEVSIDGAVVATCGAGECFGEIALLDHRRQTATVTATSDVVVDVLARQDLTTLLERHHDIADALRRTVEWRLAMDGLQPEDPAATSDEAEGPTPPTS